MGLHCVPGQSYRARRWSCALTRPGCGGQVQGLLLGPLRAGNQTVRFDAGARARALLCRRRTHPKGCASGSRLPTAGGATFPPVPAVGRGLWQGAVRRGVRRAPQGRPGAQAGDLCSIAVCFLARPELRAPVRAATTLPSPPFQRIPPSVMFYFHCPPQLEGE